jgi:hypothetical protein
MNEKDKLIGDLKKENFGLKLRIYYLEENLPSKENRNRILELESQLKEKTILNNKLFKGLRKAHDRRDYKELKFIKNSLLLATEKIKFIQKTILLKKLMK